MKRRVISEPLPDGVWLKLDCGHAGKPDSIIDGEADCTMCDLRRIPTNALPVRRTPTFDKDSVPAGLLAAHKTSAWAKLVVTEGTVAFFDEQPAWRTTVSPRRSVVIVPGRLHHIEPDSGAEFHVQFYAQPVQ